jgi:hypothetical protein
MAMCGISMEQFEPTRVVPGNMVFMMNAEVVVEQSITLVKVPPPVGTFAYTLSPGKPARVVAKRRQPGPWAYPEKAPQK